MSRSAATERPKATYEDLRALPAGLTGQLIQGVLYAHPRPAAPHAMVSSGLLGELYSPFRRGRGGPGGWWILHEPELHLGDDVLVPDLAGWRLETLPDLPSVKASFFTVRPDWICEVLSPATASVDRVKKWQVYLREKVTWLWFVDPIGRTLETFGLEQDRYVALGTWGPGECARAVPFDAIELELDALWGPEEAR